MFLTWVIKQALNKVLPFLFIMSATLILFLQILHLVVCRKNIFDLAGTGTYLTGIAAMLAVLYGKSYWKEKRSEAASKALSLFKNLCDNVCEIISRPTLYKHNDYYPFNMPEKRNQIGEGDWWRPATLINNEMGFFRRGLSDVIFQISGKEHLKIAKLEQELDVVLRQITGYLQALLGNHPEGMLISKGYNSSNEEYQLRLKNILEKAVNELSPLIESGF